jgi:hypothetical protein
LTATWLPVSISIRDGGVIGGRRSYSVVHSCSPYMYMGLSMRTSRVEHCCRTKRTVGLVVAAVVVTTVHIVSATTYISVEPIPNRDVVGEENLTLIRSIGYSHLERWSERLLSECLAVDSVIEALTAHSAITSVTRPTPVSWSRPEGSRERPTRHMCSPFRTPDQVPQGCTMSTCWTML